MQSPTGQRHDRDAARGEVDDDGSISPTSVPTTSQPSLDQTSQLAATRVRFSSEISRPTQDFGPRHAHAGEIVASPANSGTTSVPRSPKTSLSARARNRGYSLRRSLFAQNIQGHGTPDGTVFEMEPAGSSSMSVVDSRSSIQEQQKKHITVTVIESTEGDDDQVTSPIYQGHGSRPMLSPQRWTAKDFFPVATLWKIKDKWRNVAGNMFVAKQPPPSPDGRHVRVNTSKTYLPPDERTGEPFVDNTIISCRYTPWNFLPRQLFAQFSKIANFYFLVISTMQMIPGLSTTGTYTTIIPLLLFVGISMAKEGYDDIRRHRLDKEDNEREVSVLDSRVHGSEAASQKGTEAGYPESTNTGWRTEKWQNVRVGNVVLLERDTPVPADIILLHADELTGSAFIETKSLDGETNLKTKKPLADLSQRCGSVDAIAEIDAEFVAEDPNLDLYKFDGRVTVAGQTLPLTNNEIVYRGSVLRNTPSAVGIVIYSGEECKIRMNATKNPRVKAPTLQARVNKVVILVASMVIFIAIIESVLYRVWKTTTEEHAWYLTSASVPFGHVVTSFIIMFNTMLPLSLYVSLEICKVAQMFLMNDIDMYDPESDTPMEPHTSTINEELGQVSYIFSDKTGTLTNNSMKFRKMSVAGTAWLHDIDLQQEMADAADKPKLLHKKRREKGKGKASLNQKPRKSAVSFSERLASGKPSMQGAEWKPSTRPSESLHCGKTEQLVAYLMRRPQTAYAKKARFFILALALCHTCIPEKDHDGNIDYQAASPDELALVNAAHDLGYIVSARSASSITVKSFPSGEDDDPVHEVYEILDVIEFSSARKRMSIIIRLPDQRIAIFTKGADTTIQKLLRLADMARRSKSDVDRRASERKSLEAQEVLRRKSIQVRAGSRKSRSSVNTQGHSPIVGRQSSISISRNKSVRESVDVWLKDKENDVDLSVPRHSNSHYTPRHSLHFGSARASAHLENRQSLGRSDIERFSIIADEVDEFIDDAVAVNEAATFEHCFQHIDDFATEGLRTLLYAFKYISESEYSEWKAVYHDAATSLVDRQEKLEAAGELIETKLDLLGATAIEDKLQAGVPDAIDRFRRANIKMWMLTGDKRETAINIGHSCRLIKDYSTMTILDHEHNDVAELLARAAGEIKTQRAAHSVLVLDGQTLAYLQQDSDLFALFTSVAVLADSVICCRASPSQKASLVRTIRIKVRGSVTLAVGDGANDIAMIQEAHVGIGIAGKEGLQAARTSDYSIAQFRFLLKLLLVHGRWNYVRICKYTLGTFWKEMFFYLVQAIYQRWNGYTGTSLYEPWSLSMFNTLFTSLPVIFMGVFEKDLAASTLLAVPELYNLGQCNRGFNFKVYLWWATHGAAESCIVYFTMWGIYGEALFTRDQQLFAMGCLAFTSCVTCISLKLQFIELHNRTVAAGVAIVLSVGGWYMWNLALSGFYPTSSPIYNVNHGIIDRFGRNPLWWLTLILIVVSVCLLEVVTKSLRAYLWPSDVDTFQAFEQDRDVRKRFEESAADLLQQGWDRGTKKSSLELTREAQEQAEREAHVQELLNRPRTMTNEKSIPSKEPEVGIRRRHSGPTDKGDSAMILGTDDTAQVTKRTSLDVGELFSKGFGKVRKGEVLT